MSSSESSESKLLSEVDKVQSEPILKRYTKLKKERSSSSSSDCSKTVHAKLSTLSEKKKRKNGSSVIGESILKMKEKRKANWESSSSSSSDNEASFMKKPNKNLSISDASFASPGLSSTRIASDTTTKSKLKSKSSRTNDFFKKMISRFDENK